MSFSLRAAILTVLLATVPGGIARAEDQGASDVPAVDAKALATMLQHFDKVKKHEYPWGWIRWLMNAELDPDAKMTFGIVHVDAGRTNPLHVHPNCEEQLYVLSGSCEHRLGKQTVVLKAGDVLRIPRGVPHNARTFDKEPVRAIIVYSTGNRQFVPVER